MSGPGEDDGEPDDDGPSAWRSSTQRYMAVKRAWPHPGEAEDDEVVLLSKVVRTPSASVAPLEHPAGGIAVIASGAEAERVRRLCHQHGILLPVMPNLAVLGDGTSAIVIGEPAPPTPKQIAYVVRPGVADDLLVELLRAFVGRREVVAPAARAPREASPVVAAAGRITATADAGELETVAIEEIIALTRADRAYCLFHDPFGGALWSESRRVSAGDDRRSTAGIVGWAAHTGRAIHASPVGHDQRWVLEIDDPEGKALSRLVVQPVVGADRHVRALLVAARRWRRSDFTDDEKQHLAQLAALTGPVFDVGSHARARAARTTLPSALARAIERDARKPGRG